MFLRHTENIHSRNLFLFKSSFVFAFDLNDNPSEIVTPAINEDVFSYIKRVNGKLDLPLYWKIAGSANHLKEVFPRISQRH